MTAQAAEQPQRDAATSLDDYRLEIQDTAIFFAHVICHGVPDAMTLTQMQAMAARFLTAQVPVYRYWNGKAVSGPQHEAEGARQ